MPVVDRFRLEAPFALLYAAGVRFSTLLADTIKYAGHRRVEVAQRAGVSDRQLKSCIQEAQLPTASIRRAMIDCIGFDPWQLKSRIDRREWRLAPEDVNLLRELAAPVNALVDDPLAPDAGYRADVSEDSR